MYKKNIFKIYVIIIFFYKLLLIFYSKKFLYLPYRHYKALLILNKFKEISKKLGFVFFLDSGLLLGAVRQGCFAGRPKDLDIGVKDHYKKKILSNLNYIKKFFYCQKPFPERQKNSFYFLTKKEDKLFLRLDGLLFQINFYKYDKKKRLWIRFHDHNDKGKKYYLPSRALKNLKKIKTYLKYEFYIPMFYEKLLIQMYGKNWKIIEDKKGSTNFIFD
jgi:hypothetical protein